jgi:hypothetical protein
METTTNSIASCAANTPARGRFGTQNIASEKHTNCKPNRHAAGMEPAQSAIEFEVFINKLQEDANHVKALEASNEGVRYTPVGAGLRIDDSSGTTEILITQIQSEQAVYASLNQFTMQGETIGTAAARLYEDGVPYALNSANPNGGKRFEYKHSGNTIDSIALCAYSMPAKCLKHL